MGNIFQLDKDLLSKGNKIYSENTCVFLPLEINSALAIKDSNHKKFHVGVRKNRNKYEAICCINSKSTYLGLFDTEIEAFKAYKQAKESYLKELANKWKGKIDDRAYNALLNYQVEITD